MHQTVSELDCGRPVCDYVGHNLACVCNNKPLQSQKVTWIMSGSIQLYWNISPAGTKQVILHTSPTQIPEKAQVCKRSWKKDSFFNIGY